MYINHVCLFSLLKLIVGFEQSPIQIQKESIHQSILNAAGGNFVSDLLLFYAEFFRYLEGTLLLWRESIISSMSDYRGNG